MALIHRDLSSLSYLGDTFCSIFVHHVISVQSGQFVDLTLLDSVSNGIEAVSEKKYAPMFLNPTYLLIRMISIVTGGDALEKSRYAWQVLTLADHPMQFIHTHTSCTTPACTKGALLPTYQREAFIRFSRRL